MRAAALPRAPLGLPDLVAALRLLRRPAWAFGLVILVVGSALFVRLGEWQHARYEAKLARNAAIDANFDRAPVPLDELLPPSAASLPAAEVWRPARVAGRYRTAVQILVRQRQLGDQTGYEVLAPVDLDGGGVLVVDRGWVPTPADGSVPAAVPVPPSGPVSLVARLRTGEGSVTRSSPPGQIERIDLAALSRTWGPVRPAYGLLVAESPPAVGTLQPAGRPDEDLGPHLGYAWQWWMFAVAGYGVFAYYLVLGARREAGAPARPGPWRRPDRPATDEEWEDAAVDAAATRDGSSGTVPRR